MKIILNGEKKIISEGMNILQLLEEFKISPNRVAVEINKKIVKREHFNSTEIKNDDKIEIVRMMGGG